MTSNCKKLKLRIKELEEEVDDLVGKHYDHIDIIEELKDDIEELENYIIEKEKLEKFKIQKIDRKIKMLEVD